MRCLVMSEIKIEELLSITEDLAGLSDLLVKVVDDGASIGFLPPMKHSAADEYWETVLKPEVILYVAKWNDEIVGTVQLHLCTKQNGLHRAEIAKLMTHPDYRGRGIARTLMKKAEERAKLEERILLVLDTRAGDPSNYLYLSLGFVEAGRIPFYAKSGEGNLDTTVLYYKTI